MGIIVKTWKLTWMEWTPLSYAVRNIPRLAIQLMKEAKITANWLELFNKLEIIF